MTFERKTRQATELKEVKEKHPLEGKYIIFVYSEGDAEGEGSTLNLARLKNGCLQFLYNPQACTDPADLERIDSANEILQILKKRKITTVYSIFHTHDFLDIPSGEQLFKEPQETKVIADEEEESTEPSESWYEYAAIHNDIAAYDRLTQAGIKIIYWDEDRQQELK